eukprot:CAMPEP_0202879218 /NCGR_PEP_ID=MMETSP1391-20130828/33313_1 /ASSEMBLY_ACC=CAM_ASM_000867 /TAXON_ID=1034604 /ORGANISM="Chlamydomonas leiostraca, Strain SAG 11-49" /LENGTH=82 /DNA_ID=CAMNT_0049561533 /DNA_START=209 /DNA_END=454 /DNA_ORIENTATION=-
MCAGTPRTLAARARAAAWLPELWVTTPFAASCSLSENTALHAPLYLKAPVFWKISHLKCSCWPDSASNDEDVSTGVWCTRSL